MIAGDAACEKRGVVAYRRSGPGRKRGAYSQAERVLRLHAALLDGRIVRVPDFADELGISARQVQRDLALVRGHLGDRLAQRDDGAWVVRRELASAADRRSARSAIRASTMPRPSGAQSE